MQGRAVVVEPAVAVFATLVGTEDRLVEDPALEFKLCAAAIPAALALGLLFHILTPGLQRIFFGMPIHELGHALAAWFCGHAALPTLWKTLVAEERGWLAPLLLTGAIGYGMVRAHWAGKTFGGDGIGMVLATALMATFFFGKRTQLYKGWLRWGLLAIGAAAFTDMFATWWKALSDTGAIPFGEIEGVGLSDPAKLVEEWGWNTKDLVRRYVSVGVSCLAALAVVYAWGVRNAWRKAKGLDEN